MKIISADHSGGTWEFNACINENGLRSIFDGIKKGECGSKVDYAERYPYGLSKDERVEVRSANRNNIDKIWDKMISGEVNWLQSDDWNFGCDEDRIRISINRRQDGNFSLRGSSDGQAGGVLYDHIIHAWRNERCEE